MSDSRELTLSPSPDALTGIAGELPAAIAEAGPAGRFAWDEYFAATIRNHHTRTAYRRPSVPQLARTE